MPSLPKVRDVYQPTITSFFTKTFKKQIGETRLPKATPKESKGKMNVVEEGHKEEEEKKILPRRSARAAQHSMALEPTVSKERKLLMPQSKQRQQRRKKEVKAIKPIEAKDNGKSIAESPIPALEKKKARQPVKKVKYEEKKESKQVKNRKTELENLDTSKTTETSSRRRLSEDKPQVPTQAPPPPTVQVEEKEEP